MGMTRSEGSDRDPESPRDYVMLECTVCQSQIRMVRWGHPLGHLTAEWKPALIVSRCAHPLSSFRVKVSRHQR